MKLQRFIPYGLLVVLLLCTTNLLADYQQNDSLRSKKGRINSSINTSEMQMTGRMHSSAFPVQMEVRGRNVSIVSRHEQTLPIYTQTGTFYMAMHLSKGTNWLSGLPRGSYFINKKLVTVN